MFDPTVSCPANSYYVGNSQGEVGNYQCICNNGYVAVNGRNECQECAIFWSLTDQNDYVCRQNNSDNRQQTTGGSGNTRAATVQNSRVLTLSPTLAQLNAFPDMVQYQSTFICTANYSRLDITDTNNDRFSGKCTCPTTLQWDRMTNTCASASTN